MPAQSHWGLRRRSDGLSKKRWPKRRRLRVRTEAMPTRSSTGASCISPVSSPRERNDQAVTGRRSSELVASGDFAPWSGSSSMAPRHACVRRGRYDPTLLRVVLECVPDDRAAGQYAGLHPSGRDRPGARLHLAEVGIRTPLIGDSSGCHLRPVRRRPQTPVATTPTSRDSTIESCGPPSQLHVPALNDRPGLV
jgi:hypothetical protein